MSVLADRIRKMAESVEPEFIASSLRIPLDVVKGILSGEIPDEALNNYDPGRPPELRVVEKKRYVRNKVIGVYGPGGTGATTIAGILSYQIARQGKRVFAVDLNEFSALAPFLGIDCWAENAVKYPNLLWLSGDVRKLMIPALQNDLHVLPGAATVQKYHEVDWGKVQEGIADLISGCETLVLDLPNPFHLAARMFPNLDCLVLVIRNDLPGMYALWQIKSLLQEMFLKTYVVVNQSVGRAAPVAVKEALNMTAGHIYLPYDPKLKFDVYSNAEFTGEVRDKLLPLLGYGEERGKKSLLSMILGGR